ncbi:hypothetical protein EMN47_03320 [Prolixibacteraceae bacterium JC049]|nr:hypothetical protein [Prolixibacteraceae bacterium JC049]
MIKFFKHNSDRIQLLLVLLVWLLLFATPILFGNSSDRINWPHIIKIWREYSVLLMIFLINRFVLMPKLFFKEKRILYFLALGSLIILFAVIVYYLKDILQGAARPDRLPFPEFKPRPMKGGPKEFIPPYANIVIMSILMIGFDSGLIFFSKWMKSEQNKLLIERESIANKMAFLKNQVSPHFFMNTLNNIHALVDIDTEEAKAAIIKLSQMMDYMLYESQSQKVSLQQEMEFISSYVELMKLRITDDVDLQLHIPDTLPQVSVPPLLTISFIENAFKYGVSYESPSFIHIHVNATYNQFFFRIENSIHIQKLLNKNSGIGIDNSRKRLELLFGSNYQLNIDTTEDIFKVNLTIPI